MYTPLTQPIANRDLPDPRLNFALMRAVRFVIQPYARALKFREPVMLHGDRMVDAYRDFREGKTRLIIAFRHAYGDDPQLMAYTLHHALPRESRRLKRPLKGVTHAHFVYGAEVPLWSGPFVRWLLPNVGAVPINHVHMDSSGMNRIRKTISSGIYPLALAPEGHVTYESENVGELEAGTARFGFWCIEDLAREGRAEKVVFLPVSTHYRYGPGDARALERVIGSLEEACALTRGNRKDRSIASLRERLAACGREILSITAAFYRERSRTEIARDREALLDAALSAAEGILALDRRGNDFERLYRVRTAAWDLIIRDDSRGMSPLRLDLARRETGEAWFAMRHMETAELLAHVCFGEIPEDADLNGLFEIANNYRDMLGRLAGGTLKNRVNEAPRRPVIVTGEPIVLDELYPNYREDKRSALALATERIREGFLRCIEDYRSEYR
jgi:hypothetical protein